MWYNSRMVNIEPTKDHPMPYDTSPESPSSFRDKVIVAANTADLLSDLGAPMEVTIEDMIETSKLFKTTDKVAAATALARPSTAHAAAIFIREYANHVVADITEVRSAITAKLMELANCGEPKYELKALELLGKHSDVGLFTERSEITINHKSSDDLETAIKERVKRLMNANIIDVPVSIESLDEELGIAEPIDDVE